MASKKDIGEDIITLRRAGKSYREIMKLLNCSRSTVNYHCKKAGLTDTGMKRFPVDNETKQQIKEYCKENSKKEAMKFFGLSYSTIHKYCK